MNELGEFLKTLRGSLSLREVQDGTGISHTYLSTLEKGYDPRTKKQRKPTPEVLGKLARFYKVRYKDLMFLAGYLDNEADKNDSLTYEEKVALTKENILKIKELDELAETFMKTTNNKVLVNNIITKNNKKFDLFSIINNDGDLYYKNKQLTKDEIEKIKTLLKTFLE